jgi:hypothetical protein
MYDATQSVRSARAAYFEHAGFPADGGYGAAWVKVKIAGRFVPLFPNVAPRLRAVKLHDLHHIATGYDTSWTGEIEIAAWELASGCRSYLAAWVLNLGSLALGLVVAPRRLLRAWRRGRRSRNLYRGGFDEALLDRTVGQLRAELGLTPAA